MEEVAAPAPESRPGVRKVVQFLLGRDLFALPLEEVAHITRADEITPLPLAPAFLSGVVNLQGRLSSVVDLVRIVTGSGEGGGKGGSLLVLVPERKGLALRVDAVMGMGEYLLLEEVGTEGARAAGDASLVEGVFRRGPRLVTLLSARRLLGWIDAMMQKGEE